MPLNEPLYLATHLTVILTQRRMLRRRYTFSDTPSSEPVTADRSKAVIGYGEQPATQLSLDYVGRPTLLNQCR